VACARRTSTGSTGGPRSAERGGGGGRQAAGGGRRAAGGGRRAAGEPIGPLVGRYNAGRARQAVAEWRLVIDALQEVGFAGGPVGFWSVSMGSAIGIPLVAAEPRIRATVRSRIAD
jgi:hypothetical protein